RYALRWASSVRSLPSEAAQRRRRAIIWLAAKRQLYPGLPVRLLRDLVLLQLLVEIAARRADDLGGLRDVPAVLAQLADEERALGAFLELAQRPRLRL